nr:hypothetical protein [Tanacetum cinerariifolium]
MLPEIPEYHFWSGSSINGVALNSVDRAGMMKMEAISADGIDVKEDNNDGSYNVGRVATLALHRATTVSCESGNESLSDGSDSE